MGAGPEPCGYVPCAFFWAAFYYLRGAVRPKLLASGPRTSENISHPNGSDRIIARLLCQDGQDVISPGARIYALQQIAHHSRRRDVIPQIGNPVGNTLARRSRFAFQLC
jgi:hypothetical protein